MILNDFRHPTYKSMIILCFKVAFCSHTIAIFLVVHTAILRNRIQDGRVESIYSASGQHCPLDVGKMAFKDLFYQSLEMEKLIFFTILWK